MGISAAIADSLLRRAFGRRARPFGPAASPTRRRAQTWRSFFIALYALDVLHEYASDPPGSARQDTAGSPPRRRPHAWLDLFVEPRTSPRASAISRRTVMNHAG